MATGVQKAMALERCGLRAPGFCCAFLFVGVPLLFITRVFAHDGVLGFWMLAMVFGAWIALITSELPATIEAQPTAAAEGACGSAPFERTLA